MAFISNKVHSFSSGDIQTPATSLLPIPMWYDHHDTTTTSAATGFFDNYNYGMITTMPPAEYYDNITSIPSLWNKSSSILTPERFGVIQEMVVPASPTGGFGRNNIIAAGGADFDQKVELVQDHEYFSCNSGGGGYAGDTNSSWSSNYPIATNTWEAESKKTSKEIEEPTTTTLKIGRYSTEERKDKIMKYLKKRNQRNFNKTIKYECRKTLADKRIRVRGRFAKNNNDHHHHHHHQPNCEDQVLPNINTNSNSSEEDIQHLYTNNFLMKQEYDEEEEWLQEAMASLLYSPRINYFIN